MFKKINFVIALIFFCTFAFSNDVYYMDRYSTGQYYALTYPGMECQLIAGDNHNGLIVSGGYQNRTIKYITSYSQGNWRNLRDPGMNVMHLAGDNRKGVIVAGGSNNRTVRYLNSYSSNRWRNLPRAPFSIQALSGDNQSGPVAANGKNIAYLSYSNNRWTVLARAPFPGGNIGGLSGNNRTGVVAFSDESHSTIAYLSDYARGNWRVLNSPVVGKIKSIAGNNESGAIVHYENGSSWHMPSYGNRQWIQIDNHDAFGMDALTGENRTGIAFCTQS